MVQEDLIRLSEKDGLRCSTEPVWGAISSTGVSVEALAQDAGKVRDSILHGTELFLIEQCVFPSKGPSRQQHQDYHSDQLLRMAERCGQARLPSCALTKRYL